MAGEPSYLACISDRKELSKMKRGCDIECTIFGIRTSTFHLGLLKIVHSMSQSLLISLDLLLADIR
jgi:hypothetical protein